jgi:chemotaxis protein CheC
MISVSSVDFNLLTDRTGLFEKKNGVVVSLKILGDLSGAILFILGFDNALSLCDIIKCEPQGTSQTLSQMDISFLKESGSILSASYLNAVSGLLKMSSIPSIPELTVGTIDQLLNSAVDGLAKLMDVAYLINTEFSEQSTGLKNAIVLIPEIKSLNLLLKKLETFH